MYIDYENNKARSKHIRRFFDLEPDLCSLANLLGLKLHWRDSVLWGNDVQLSYLQRQDDETVVVLDEAGQAQVAMVVLRRIAEARREWGTLLDRAAAIIDEFDETVRKPLAVRRMHFSVAQSDSLDSCHTFGGNGSESEVEVTLCLIGEKQMSARGPTLREAVDSLRLLVTCALQHRAPSGIATRPFDSDVELAEVQEMTGVTTEAEAAVGLNNEHLRSATAKQRVKKPEPATT